MLHREIPFLRICIPLCIGILSGLLFEPGHKFFILLIPLLIVLLLLPLMQRLYFRDALSGLLSAIAFCLTGLWIYTMERDKISYLPLENITIEGIIADFPVMKENSSRVEIKLSKVFTPGNSYAAGGNLLVYLSKKSAGDSLRPGDKITLNCTPRAIRNRGNPYEFDYRFYMLTRGFRYYAFADGMDIIEISSPVKRSLPHKALIIRSKIIDMYKSRGLPEDRVALAAALTLGEKDYLDQEQKQQFIDAGVMHIMAVSGLHAVILSIFIFRLLFFLKGRFNILRVLLTIVIIWGFAFVTGLTPSVMRATLMFSFLQAGALLKRPPNSINSVLASAFILMLIKPSVIFEAGFLLSYSAVIFIIIFYTELYRKLSFRYFIPDFLWQSASVTLVAQAGTLPLTISMFNRFPAWFIVSNIIIVPVSSVVIVAGALVPVTWPLKIASVFVTKLLGLFTWLTAELTGIVSRFPYSSVEGIGLTTAETITMFIFIFVLMRYLLYKKNGGSVIVALSLLLFTAVSTFVSIRTKCTSEFIVFNNNGESVPGVRRGKVLDIYSQSAEIPKDIYRFSSVLRLRLVNHITDENPLIIEAGNEVMEIAGRRGLTTSAETPSLTVFRDGFIRYSEGRKHNLNANGALRYKLKGRDK